MRRRQLFSKLWISQIVLTRLRGVRQGIWVSLQSLAGVQVWVFGKVNEEPHTTSVSLLWGVAPSTAAEACPLLSHPIYGLLGRFAQTIRCNIFILDAAGNLLAPAIIANPFCQSLRDSPAGLALCTMSTLEMASPATDEVVLHRCALGLYGLTFAVRRDGEPVGQIVLDGFCESVPSRADVRKLASRLGLKEAALWDSICQVPVLSPERLRSIVELVLTLLRPFLGLGPAPVDPSALMTLLPAEFRPKPGQGVIITDQDGVVLQANQAILEELGYEAKDIERKNASQLFLEPPVLLEPLAWLGHPAKPLRYRARLRTSSKEAVPFDVITYSVGHPPSAIAIHVLRKAKVRPERAAPPLPSVEDILDSIPLPSIVLVDAHVAFANKKASELTGHARHDLLKKRFADLFTSESRQVLEETWARLAALEQGESMSLSVQVLREDQAINVRADFSALQWEEKRALLCTFSEVAPHVEAAPPERPEELERKITSERLEALLNTAASLSHYVNNMLVGILTSCSLLRSELPADDPVAERLQLIHESSTRITSLMRSLQRFARGLPPQRSSIDLPHLTRNVIQQVYTARGESFEPQVEIDPSTPATLADADVLTIALRNVIQNAAEASPQGGKVEVSLQPVEITEEALLEHPTARPGSYAHIRVRDYGPGISPDLLPRIIEPFVTDKFGHMGLGLSETYGIVTAYGGFMEITSTPGTGTTVDLYLPSAAVVSKEAEIPAEATRIVLVITEDAALLEATSAALHQAGYDMVPATSVAEGVDIFSRYQADIDLILLDLTAEHLNGERVLRFFQRIHAGAPVAVVTNVIDDTEAAALIAEGALDVIRKPFTAEGLLSRLQALLRPQQCGEASLDASNQT